MKMDKSELPFQSFIESVVVAQKIPGIGQKFQQEFKNKPKV